MQNDFINDILFPALFERLDTAFPEFHFKLKEKGEGLRLWESRTGHRPDGHQGKDAGKTFVSERTPFYLSDLNPIRGRSIWSYIQERDGQGGSDVFRLLCDLAGVQPEKALSPEALKRMEAARKRAEIYEAANAFLLEQLHQDTREGANKAREYLHERGYKPADLRQIGQELKDDYTGGERMEVGYLPNLPELRRYLEAQTVKYETLTEESYPAPVWVEERRFSDEEVNTIMPPRAAAGRVSLTLRERGRIVGFIFRALDDHKAKYLALEGYNRERYLPGLTRSENIVIVEGNFDAAHAHAAGLKNVVCLGGVSLSDQQIRKALRAGTRSISLALDNDQAGQAATRKAVETLLRYQDRTGEEFDVFVCRYPDGCKDLDDLLSKPGGIDQAREMIGKDKINAGQYLAKWLDKTRAPEIAEEVGGWSNDTFRAEIIRELVLIERLLRPVDVPNFRQHIDGYYNTWGIDQDAIEAAADTVRELEAEKHYRNELQALAKQAQKAASEGKTEQAENILWKDTREARLRLHSGRFAELIQEQTKEATAAELARISGGLETSYELFATGKEPVKLEFPAGAVSVIAAPSSHGKTAFLINALLDVCERGQEQEFHFFTLEESAAAVTAKMLNTFLDMDLSLRNERSLENYLKGDPQYIRAEALADMQEKEARFWRLLGKRIFVHYLEENTAENLCEAIQWLHRRRNIGGVFVDYIQLINLADPGRLARHEEMKQVCIHLKNTAVQTGLPLVFAAQFSRNAAHEGHTHDYKNIGEAGDIERVAGLIVGLWNREFTEVQHKDGKPVEGTGPTPVIGAKILKWRGGPVGHKAAWNYNGNRKRIYSHGRSPQNTSAAPGGNSGANANPFLNK